MAWHSLKTLVLRKMINCASVGDVAVRLHFVCQLEEKKFAGSRHKLTRKRRSDHLARHLTLAQLRMLGKSERQGGK